MKPPKRESKPLSYLEQATRIMEQIQVLATQVASDRGVDRWRQLPIENLHHRIRLSLEPTGPQESATRLVASLEQQIEQALSAQHAYRRGHVFCFLCNAPDCLHATPQDPQDVFVGYRPNGKPEWEAFVNLCIQRQETRVDQLFSESPAVIAVIQTASELKEGLLPGFGQGDRSYNVLGQVTVGLIPKNLRINDHEQERFALTLQIVETGPQAGRDRLQLNLIGLSMHDLVERSSERSTRGPAEALRRTLQTTRERVRGLTRRQETSERRGKPSNTLQERIAPLLSQLKGDLERVFRPLRRRTRHAQDRHIGGKRPTSKALSDARSAGDEHLLRDVQRHTIVVLGPKNRTHIFTQEGRHVTSLQLRSGELPRKVDRGRWKVLSAKARKQFRSTVQEKPESEPL